MPPARRQRPQQPKVRSGVAIAAQFRNSAGAMEKKGRARHKAARRSAKLDLKGDS